MTVWHHERAWRISLLTGESGPPGGQLEGPPPDIRARLEDGGTWQELCDAWDEMYPHNPVTITEDEDDA